MTLHSYVPPLVYSPRRVPVALREPLKEELDTLIQQGIVAKVNLSQTGRTRVYVLLRQTENFEYA